MDIDFGRLKDWDGLTFHATGVWQFGKNLGMDIGALANPSGLANAHGVRIRVVRKRGIQNGSEVDISAASAIEKKLNST